MSIEPLAKKKVLGAIEAATASKRVRWKLADEISKDPTVLTSGRTGTPLVVHRLIENLASVGAKRLIVPLCASCGRRRKLSRYLGSERVCEPCGYRAAVEVCSVCKRMRPVHLGKRKGKPVCGGCWRKIPASWKTCDRCGQVGTISKLEEGQRICARCYRAPRVSCGNCGETWAVQSRRSGIPLCHNCYQSPPRRCGICGEERPIAKNAVGDEPNFCPPLLRAYGIVRSLRERASMLMGGAWKPDLPSLQAALPPRLHGLWQTAGAGGGKVGTRTCLLRLLRRPHGKKKAMREVWDGAAPSSAQSGRANALL